MPGSMARPRKKLTKRDLRTPQGRFAAHLQSLIDRAGVSEEALADAADVGIPAVRKWLKAQGYPQVASLKALGKVLGLADYRDILPPD